MSAPTTRLTRLALTFALMAACSSGSDLGVTDAGINSGFATSDGLATVDGQPSTSHDSTTSGPADTAPAVDTQSWSTPDTSSPGVDTGTTTPSDTTQTPPDSTTPDPGCADCGQPCDDNSDCYSGWCVEGPDGDICTKTCDVDCPPGMSCRAVTSGSGSGDYTYICVPDHVFYCRPCSANSECAPLLLDTSPHRCVEHSNGAGSFCATACEDSTDCPEGAVCTLIEAEGEELTLCQPVADECTCTAASISVEATTECTITNGWGVCEGHRSCTADGLTSCDALDAAVEDCNDLDDDCDGFTDEDFPELGEPCDSDDDDICFTGEWTCYEGGLICAEWNGPTPEICNGVDDDCDLLIDEGFEQVGSPCDGDDDDLCEEGVWVCSDGGVVCDDDTGTNVETCNGFDEDCDTVVDEAFPEEGLPCDGEDADACTDGTTICSQGALACLDPADGLVELCNDADDDCDGEIDEVFPTKGSACDGADSDSCDEGVWTCDGVALVCGDTTEDSKELCNDTDDDCDGAIDENWSNKGTPCDSEADSDACLDGQYVCNGTTLICDDDSDSLTETCNGLDDDCDGATDENLVQTCSSSCGTGQETCSQGIWVGCTAEEPLTCTDFDSCSTTPMCVGTCPTAPSEVCDTIDNDCDGATDEGHLADTSLGSDFVDAWSDALPFMGVYPASSNGAIYGKLLPQNDIDWFTVEATEDKSDFCVTDGQDDPITATLLLNSPGGTLDYEMCACWSSAGGFCEKGAQQCATSFNGSNAELTLVMGMSCGGTDVGYLDIQVQPNASGTDYGCDLWSVSWSIVE